MAVTSLSIVLPTLGRPSLERTLASCSEADEVIVVLDNSRGTTKLPCRLPANARLHVGSYGVTGGHAGRAEGIRMATGTHLAFMDDDDIYLPGAIQDYACRCGRPTRHLPHGPLRPRPPLARTRHQVRERVDTDVSSAQRSRPVRFLDPPCSGHSGTGRGLHVHQRDVRTHGRTDLAGGNHREATSEPWPTIAVVTPWYNHLEHLDGYMDAMEAGPYPDELIVVDNASDPPLEFAAVRLDRNAGFSGGSNAGLAAATADIVAFVNNDVALGQAGWLRTLRAKAEPGVLVGAVLRTDAHSWVDGIEVPYLDGWCLAGMRDDLLDLGGFDETLAEPAYYSDNLLCLEARAAGFRLREEPMVKLRHLCNGSIGPENRERQRAASRANRERYVARVRELLVPSPEGVGATV